MIQEHPSLRLLREVRRLERIGHRFTEPVDMEKVWDALHTFPPEISDAPGWFDRLFVPLAHHPMQTAYGEVVHFWRIGFFSTAPVPFTGIVLPGGGEAVAFRAMVRKDLAPIVLRFATERLLSSFGGRFPCDLVNPTAFKALLELAFAGDKNCRYRFPLGSVPVGDEGEIPLESVNPPTWRKDRVCLIWGPQYLGFRSDSYGLF